MPQEKSEFRLRVSQPVPFDLSIEDESGKWVDHYDLLYTLNSLSAWERETGKSAIQQLGYVLHGNNATEITALLWVGSKRHYAAGVEGLEAIRTNVTLTDLVSVVAACTKAILSQLPKETADRIKAIRDGATPLPDPMPASA